MMSSQSSKSRSWLLPGGILSSNFWTPYYCLLALGILLISVHLWSKMDFYLNVVIIKFVTLFPFYSINLLCMWHFELTEHNTGKTGHIGNTPSEKKECIAWPSHAFYCRNNESLTAHPSSPSAPQPSQVAVIYKQWIDFSKKVSSDTGHIHCCVCKATENYEYKLGKSWCKYPAGDFADGFWAHFIYITP